MDTPDADLHAIGLFCKEASVRDMRDIAMGQNNTALAQLCDTLSRQVKEEFGTVREREGASAP